MAPHDRLFAELSATKNDPAGLPSRSAVQQAKVGFPPQLSRSRLLPRSAEVGHFDQFAPMIPSVGYLFGLRTFALTTDNGQDAPIADLSVGRD